MKQLRVGFALCGSFCTLSKAIAEMRELKAKGADILIGKAQGNNMIII